AIILESIFHDIASTFSNRIGGNFPAWFKRFSHGVIWVTERRLGIKLNQLAPVNHIGELAPAPVMIVTGSEDVHAPPADAQRLYGRCQGPRELWLVANAGHKNVFETAGPEYAKRILGFLERWAA